MAIKKVLKVRPVEGRLVTNYEHQANGTLAFVGHKAKRDGAVTRWKLIENVVELPDRAEYRHAVKRGDLKAATLETAKICGTTMEAPNA